MSTQDETIAFGPIKFTSNQLDAGGRAYKDRGWYEEFRNPIYEDIRALIDPEWVIDIGANYGLTTLFSRLRFPRARILAVEPFAAIAEYIRMNAKANDLADFEVIDAFVGETAGDDFEFHVLEGGSQDCRVRSPSPNGKWKPVRTRQTSLNHLTNGIAAHQGVYIKIDTQGYEEHVFKGGERFLGAHQNWIIKTEFAPNWLRSQGSDPLDLLQYLVERYVVCEAPARPRFGEAALREATRRPVAAAELPAFLDYIEELNRRRLGWVDLLVLPATLHARIAEVAPESGRKPPARWWPWGKASP